MAGKRIRNWLSPASSKTQATENLSPPLPSRNSAPTQSSPPLVRAEEVRQLCDLVRLRFSLDQEIWSLRSVRPSNHDIVYEKMKYADATLEKIRRTIASWDRKDMFLTEEDWEVFQEIKSRIEMHGKR